MATLNFGNHLNNFLELMGTIKRTFRTFRDVYNTRDDSQTRFLAQHSYIVATLFRMVTTLFQHRYESSGVTSPPQLTFNNV